MQYTVTLVIDVDPEDDAPYLWDWATLLDIDVDSYTLTNCEEL